MHRTLYQRHRVAEEAQLLAEEKWILSALEKIKTQRNCLQIERLQLESMKNQLKSSSSIKSPSHDMQEMKQTSTPVTFNLSMMQKASNAELTSVATTKENFFEAETLCNKEELNLNVTKSNLMVTEEASSECEDDYEEDDSEDLLIDMNMFMHGTQTNSYNANVTMDLPEDTI